MKALRGVIDGDIIREKEFEITENDPLYWMEVLDQVLAHNQKDNCGTGAGGFQPGNTCAKGSDWSSGKSIKALCAAAGVFTQNQLDKIEVLNPHGLQNGKFRVPYTAVKIAYSDEITPQLAWMMGNLPEGIVIVKSSATNVALGLTKVVGTGEDYVGSFTTFTAGQVSSSQSSPVPEGYDLSTWQSQYSAETLSHLTPVVQTQVGAKPLPPPPNFIDKAYAEANSAVAQQMYAAAQTGDLSEYMGQQFASPKLTQYRDQLQAAIVSQQQGGSTELRVTFASGQMYDEAQHAAWRNTLSSTEQNAIQSWKGSSFGMRQSFTSGSTDQRTRSFVLAIEREAPHEGVTYRGVYDKSKNETYATDTFNQIVAAGVGGVWVDDAPHCTSVNSSTGHNFSHGDLLFRIVTASGRPIHREDGHVGEAEIVGRANTVYQITGIYQNVRTQHGSVKMFVDLAEVVGANQNPIGNIKPK